MQLPKVDFMVFAVLYVIKYVKDLVLECLEQRNCNWNLKVFHKFLKQQSISFEILINDGSFCSHHHRLCNSVEMYACSHRAKCFRVVSALAKRHTCTVWISYGPTVLLNKGTSPFFTFFNLLVTVYSQAKSKSGWAGALKVYI